MGKSGGLMCLSQINDFTLEECIISRVKHVYRQNAAPGGVRDLLNSTCEKLKFWAIFVSWSDVGKALSRNVLVGMTWMPKPFSHLSPANKSPVHRQLLLAGYLWLLWSFVWLFNVNYFISIVSNSAGKKLGSTLRILSLKGFGQFATMTETILPRHRESLYLFGF